MAKSAILGSSLLRRLLTGASTLALLTGPLAIGDAAAGVGVTSATDGDPLGKPPAEAERVLRIGIDVQANELITTSANDRAHLVFLDGSSLTVGPNAQLTIDKFVFDPTTKTGELAINATKGVLRLVGGKISKTTPITITTPSSTIGIRGGIAIMDVNSNQTGSIFVFGQKMTVTAAGQTQNVTRPGSEVLTMFGRSPGQPTLLAQGALSGQLSQLEGRSSGGQSTGQGASSGRNVDQAAQSSGFSAANSGQPVRIVGLRPGDNFGSGPGPRNWNPNSTVVTAVSSTNNTAPSQQSPQTQQALQEQLTQSQQQQQQTQQQQTSATGVLDTQFGAGSTGDFSDTFNRGLGAFGRITTVSELNTLALQRATATYTGQISGFVNNNAATGTYQNAWSFGNRNGIATLQFDGRTYGGGSTPNTFQINNTPFFKSDAPLQSSAGSTAKVIGVFASSPGAPAKAQVGIVTVNGPSYKGAGVFVGTRP